MIMGHCSICNVIDDCIICGPKDNPSMCWLACNVCYLQMRDEDEQMWEEEE
jgi:hypothetical protein